MDCLQAQGHASQLPEVSETKTHSRTSTLYSLKSHFSPDFEVFFDTLCELLRGARPCPAGLSGPGRGARAAPADSGDTASGIHSAQ